MTLSEEVADVSTEWSESGKLRLRRRIVTETRTLQVQVRREELVIDVKAVSAEDGVLVGTDRSGPRTTPPQPADPLVIVLQEEVPEVTLRLTPYEIVTVSTILVTRHEQVQTQLRHEQLDFDRQIPVSNLSTQPADSDL